MEDGVDPDSEQHVTPAAKTVEAGCPICLESFKDKAFVDVCFHTFCFACILQWADVVSSCPMCKVPFKSIIHNVRGVDDYDQHEIKPKPVLVSQEVSLAEARRFWYRTTRLTSTRKGHKSSPTSKRSVPRGRDVAAQKRRKAVYSANVWVKPLPAEHGVKKIRVANAQFYKANPAATHRLMPWLTREFQVILGEENASFVVALVNSMLSKHDIASPEFALHLRPFLFEQTDHFVHEFVSFAQSPYDMIAYDDKAEYDVPSDGVCLPELPTVDELAGPSGISSSQQNMLDDLHDDRDESPSMKQCRGDDDTSISSSSHNEEVESREKKDKERRRSYSYSHSRDHSRDNGDKRISHNDYSRSRKMHADNYDNRDRHGSSSRYGDRSSRYHSHRRKHRHGYSSSSSAERNSYKRRHQSSYSPEKHHSDRHRRKDKKRKLSKSDRSDRRQSSSTGKKKKKRHRHHSSNSNSPASHRHGDSSHGDHPKAINIISDDKGSDELKQTSDEVLQEELGNLETQISMDKKMLLKNLLRKERLELLHESLEKEQSNEDVLVTSDDDKLKEELQQLDEAITTGKNALMKVMKRIGNTDSERNISEQ